MINSILQNEVVLIIFTLIFMLLIAGLFVCSQKGKIKLQKLQKYYSYVKPADFQFSTNGGPNPCENDAMIEDSEICGLSKTMFLDKKGSI